MSFWLINCIDLRLGEFDMAVHSATVARWQILLQHISKEAGKFAKSSRTIVEFVLA